MIFPTWTRASNYFHPRELCEPYVVFLLGNHQQVSLKSYLNFLFKPGKLSPHPQPLARSSKVQLLSAWRNISSSCINIEICKSTLTFCSMFVVCVFVFLMMNLPWFRGLHTDNLHCSCCHCPMKAEHIQSLWASSSTALLSLQAQRNQPGPPSSSQELSAQVLQQVKLDTTALKPSATPSCSASMVLVRAAVIHIREEMQLLLLGRCASLGAGGASRAAVQEEVRVFRLWGGFTLRSPCSQAAARNIFISREPWVLRISKAWTA